MDNIKKFEDFLDRMQGLLDNAKKQGHIIVRVEDLEKTFPELREEESKEKPNGGIVMEDFNEGNGFYKVNLNYLNKEQVEEIEELVKKWNPELKESEDEKIRNGIIKYLSYIKDRDGSYMPNNIPFDDMIAWLEKQGEIDKTSYDIAEKEKNDFVSGQFIECRKLFNEFKEDNSYWLEYVGNDTYIGRSDNILNKKFYITPRQLYRLFTQQHFYKENNVVNEEQVHFPKFTFDDVLALQCCLETVKKVQEDKDLYEKLKDLHSRVYDAYQLEKQGEQKSGWSEDDNSFCKENCKGYQETGRCFADGDCKAKREAEQKPAWSEEDVRNIENIDSILFYDKDLPEEACIRLRNWLKSLKERINGK